MDKEVWLLLYFLLDLLQAATGLERVVGYAYSGLMHRNTIRRSEVCYWQESRAVGQGFVPGSLSHVVAVVGVLRPDFKVHIRLTDLRDFKQLAALKAAGKQYKLGILVDAADTSDCPFGPPSVAHACRTFFLGDWNASSRRTFAKSLVSLAADHDLDSVGVSFSDPFSFTDYVSVARDIRTAINNAAVQFQGRDGLQLFASDSIPKNLTGINTSGLDQYVDWLALDAGIGNPLFDIEFNTRPTKVNQPICPMLRCGSSSGPDVASEIQTWLTRQQFPASKLEVDFRPQGMPMLLQPGTADVEPYKAQCQGLDSSLRSCSSAQVATAGLPAYQISELPLWNEGIDPLSMSSYARYGDHGWISYESPQSLVHKLCYIKDLKLGGIGLRNTEWDDSGLLLDQLQKGLRLSQEQLCGLAYQRPTCQTGASSLPADVQPRQPPTPRTQAPQPTTFPYLPLPAGRTLNKSQGSGHFPTSIVAAVAISGTAVLLAMLLCLLAARILKAKYRRSARKETLPLSQLTSPPAAGLQQPHLRHTQPATPSAIPQETILARSSPPDPSQAILANPSPPTPQQTILANHSPPTPLQTVLASPSPPWPQQTDVATCSPRQPPPAILNSPGPPRPQHLPDALKVQFQGDKLSPAVLPHWNLRLSQVHWEGWALIGVGGQNFVYRGRYREQLVAVKVAKEGDDEDEDDKDVNPKKQMQQEAWMLAQINHPHVVQLLGGCPLGSRPFLVEELMEFNLHDYLHERSGQLMPLEEVLAVGCCLASALCALHSKNFVHMDIKPANVLLDRKGSVKLSDLGFACIKRGPHVIGNVAMGTLPYMAPERLGDKLVGELSDIYSLAVTLWQCASGKEPWKGMEFYPIMYQVVVEGNRPPIPPLPNPRWPAALVDLIQRCWAQEPLLRPSAQQVLKMLQDIQQQLHHNQTNKQAPGQTFVSGNN